jgi:hypothetical protein
MDEGQWQRYMVGRHRKEVRASIKFKGIDVMFLEPRM